MKIGDADVSNDDRLRINQILGSFFGQRCEAVAITAPSEGRSARGKQYKIQVSNGRVASVKRAFSRPENLYNETFMADVRQILRLPHYRVDKRNGFPIEGWQKEDYIIMDWGPAGRRLNVGKPEVSGFLRANPGAFLPQLGQVAAQNFLFATGDRKREHLIWDLDDRVLFSIDHEMTATNKFEVTSYFKNELKSLCGDRWFYDKALAEAFENRFKLIFKAAKEYRDAIVSKYIKHGIKAHHAGFVERVNVGALPPLQWIMS